MKRTKALYLFIWTVIIVTCILLITAKLAGANADDPEQHRIVLFLPVVLQQCRIGQDCALPEPPAQPECDEEYWWMCE
jgi:hypothetical protein